MYKTCLNATKQQCKKDKFSILLMRIFSKLAVDLFPMAWCLRGWKEKSFILWGLFPAPSKPGGWAEGSWTGGGLLPLCSNLSGCCPSPFSCMHSTNAEHQEWTSAVALTSVPPHCQLVAEESFVLVFHTRQQTHSYHIWHMDQLVMDFNFTALEGKKPMFFLWTLLSSRKSHPPCNHC